ncbi:MAG: hypothetical protein M3342_15440 [Bacteroidota bacterium]|nr:hypothetical protein [Bacteroidota bacterium]
MRLHVKRLLIALVLVFMAIYTLDNVVVRRRWNGVVLLTLSVYLLMLIFFFSHIVYKKRYVCS